MKKNENISSFRQSMNGLHTWAGLLPAWILYFMFITGTASYFRVEITSWMQPEIPFVSESIEQSKLLTLAENYLNQVAPHADFWTIVFPNDRDHFLKVFWLQELTKDEKEGLNKLEQKNKRVELRGRDKLHVQTGLWNSKGTTQVRETGGGEDLYRMHFELRYFSRTTGEYIVIFCTLFMLVGLITGIVIHKKIFKDFFTFRPGKKRRSWLDAHNIFSVLTIPFQLMITYSGLLFFLSIILPLVSNIPATMVGQLGLDVPNVVSAVKNKELESLSKKDQKILSVVGDAIGQNIFNKPIGVAATLQPLNTFLLDTNNRFPNKEVRLISVNSPNDMNAQVETRLRAGPSRRGGTLKYNGVSGEFESGPVSPSVPLLLINTLKGLHEAKFSPPLLRWLFFFSGLMGAGMIATGSILWVVKRRTKLEQTLKKSHSKTSKGLLLVELLNIATIVGFPIGIAAYFWANRLIPVGIATRADWEMHTLFIVWGVMFVFTVSRPLKRAWFEMLCLAAAAYALLPIINLLTTNRHLGVSLMQGDWVMAGFDLTMLTLGLAFAVMAVRVRHKQILVAKNSNEIGIAADDIS